MADQQQLIRLTQDIVAWNKWREKHPEIQINLMKADLSKSNLRGTDLHEAKLSQANLSGADLSGANLRETNMSGVDLREANLSGANLVKADLGVANLRRADLRGAILNKINFMMATLRDADLSGANLSEADLTGADLTGVNLSQANLMMSEFKDAILKSANLSQADLRGAKLSCDLYSTNLNKANLSGTDLREAYLKGADLSEANLSGANLVGADLRDATLTGCSIYGISAWDVQLEGAKQIDLIITTSEQPTITVDNLKPAQLIYLLLNNKEIREVVDTLSKKMVLILGRFTAPRMGILDAIRDELRKHNYLPVLFDFDKPASRDTFETITTLARLSRFVIADITNPKSIPGELVSIVEAVPSLPVQPLLKYGSKPWGMYDHIKKYPWVLELHRYKDLSDLLPSLRSKVIEPAEQKARELTR